MSSFCLGCGNSSAEGARFCEICGRDAQAAANFPSVDPSVAFGLPPETSGKAIFSLISGILFLILPFSVVAVVFGYLSLYDIRKSGGKLTGRRLAITGIILGYVGVAVIIGFIGLGIYAARQAEKGIAYNTARQAETSVVTTVRTLNTAEIAYSQSHPKIGYTCAMSDLSQAWGISSDIAGGRKKGYVFELHSCSAAKTDGPIVKYQVVAYPEKQTTALKPAFCSDQSDVIRVARSGSAEDCLNHGADLTEREITHPQIWQ
jgi:hypothetical protein